MRDDFCAIILTHGRPDRVMTYHSLRKAGYTGPIYLLVDDLDPTAGQYREAFGEQVIVFDKRAAAAKTDDGGVSQDLRSVIYARNVVHDVVRDLGFRYFLMLDDDYREWKYTWLDGYGVLQRSVKNNIGNIFDVLISYYERTKALSIALAQGGDFIGGTEGKFSSSLRRRKAMNAFFCSVDRPFQFVSKLNDDVSTYIVLGARGNLFFTHHAFAIQQEQTQKNAGGLTEIYRALGTYVKSFSSVIYAPSAVRVGMMGGKGGGQARIHHEVLWRNAVPQIIRERHRKPRRVGG